MAKATHTVNHPSLYMMVGGSLTQMTVGDELSLTDAQAERLGDKVKAIGEKKVVSVGSGASTDVTAEQFAEAVGKLDADNEQHFTNAGEPDVNALKGLGVNVTAAIRSELWKAYTEAAK